MAPMKVHEIRTHRGNVVQTIRTPPGILLHVGNGTRCRYFRLDAAEIQASRRVAAAGRAAVGAGEDRREEGLMGTLDASSLFPYHLFLPCKKHGDSAHCGHYNNGIDECRRPDHHHRPSDGPIRWLHGSRPVNAGEWEQAAERGAELYNHKHASDGVGWFHVEGDGNGAFLVRMFTQQATAPDGRFIGTFVEPHDLQTHLAGWP